MSSPNQIPALQKEKSKYKIGDKIWVECRDWSTNVVDGIVELSNKVRYIGPAVFRGERDDMYSYKETIYLVDVAIDVTGFGREWGVTLDQIKYRL